MAGMRTRRRRSRRRKRKQRRRRNYHNRGSLRQGVGAAPRFFFSMSRRSLSFCVRYDLFIFLSIFFQFAVATNLRLSPFNSLFAQFQRIRRVCEGENNRRENAVIEKEDSIPSVQRLPARIERSTKYKQVLLLFSTAITLGI